ncbi:ABC transporter permease [Loigolactobacillus backii]|uniref:ABC transporter permease n=4 Tax=Loigolactobacillus backii TaxID=375175 RepID=UPI0007F0A3B0|nr:ABC transporter permease [Loigolactobacillus backii]ANK58905.1 ABC transporter permease [Loigolactobacillus backii]ANK66342.1 ABC transporter permease [Loigolactobacillus backii]OLF69306.1 ABC transporter permease [Loigolactobacillus backii]PIO84126.1 ABC transporter permease [Loigolactobacillus backii]PIO88459.1 ABC transporter permease [Loigolactobacillus backii]
MRNSQVSQSGYLTRFYLRRDWLPIGLWLLGIVGLMGAAAGKFDGIYGTQSALASIVTTLKSPAMVSLFGPFIAKAPYTPAAVYAAEMMVFMGLIVAMMAIYFAVRNTRTEEDNGILELVRAHAVGKQSPLIAATLELLIINLMVGVLSALALQGAGMTGSNTTGDWLFGLGLAAFGFMFGTFSLLMSQLASNSRGATSLSYLVLGALYIARMLTDVQNTDATWWTVYGWIEKLAIYGKNNWLPIVLMLLLAIAVLGVTFFASAKRDVTAGLLPSRPGRQRASRLLAGPFSLVFRLERTSLIIWMIGLFVLGVSYGSIFGTVGDLMKANPVMAKVLGTAAVNVANRTVILNFAATLAIIFAVVGSIPAMITVLKLNSDERKGWLEQLHAKHVSRARLYSSYVVVALINGIMALFLGVLGMAVAGTASMTHPLTITRILRAFVGYLPALLVVLGITAVLVGLLPRLQALSWVVPIYGVFSLYLGGLFDLPKWAKQLTPYGWVNRVPLSRIQWGTFWWMTGLAVILLLIGYYGYAHRDLLEN